MKWIRLWCERLTSPKSDTWAELGEAWELYTKLMCYAGTTEQHGKIALPGTSVGYSIDQLAEMCRMPQDRFDRQFYILKEKRKVKIIERGVLEVLDWASFQTPYDKQIEKGYRERLQQKVTGKGFDTDDQKIRCSEEEKTEVRIRKPPNDEKSDDTPTRTFVQECVDRALVSYEKRYCATRNLGSYPGGSKALTKGYGVVTEVLAGFFPDFPKTKAAVSIKTPEELKHIASVVQIAWVGYLDRAAEIDKSAREIPGKDGTWLRFPSTPAQFCNRIPQLTESDVAAAQKRVADVAEARKNSRRMNPEPGPTVRYGEKENVIP